MSFNVSKLRFHAEQVLVMLDALERTDRLTEQRVLDLLATSSAGLTTRAIAFIVRKRHTTVGALLKRMAAEGKLTRDGFRWRVE